MILRLGGHAEPIEVVVLRQDPTDYDTTRGANLIPPGIAPPPQQVFHDLLV
jgi:hypothetical protein